MTIIIATGGSGGHIIPAALTACELMNSGHDIVFIGSYSSENDLLKRYGFNCINLGAKGFSFNSFFGPIQAACAMVAAIWKSFGLIREIRPDAVAGFGGYGSFPVVLAAALMGKPTIIHEQNVLPGKANKMLSVFAKRIAISFKQSEAHFNAKKTVLTGCPCHGPASGRDKGGALAHFHLHHGKKTILVSGGSQGSHKINEVFLKAAGRLKGQMDFQVIHLTGKSDFPTMKAKYNEIGIPFAIYEFLDKMEEAYSAADLVICRSGAVTVSEIARFQLPSIFIPYPHAQGHQRDNAALFVDRRFFRIIDDRDLSTDNLTAGIEGLLGQYFGPDEIGKEIGGICQKDADRKLADQIIGIAHD